MAENKAKSSYTAADIDLLEGLSGVRKRPAMYIGSTNLNGVHHLVEARIYLLKLCGVRIVREPHVLVTLLDFSHGTKKVRKR